MSTQDHRLEHTCHLQELVDIVWKKGGCLDVLHLYFVSIGRCFLNDSKANRALSITYFETLFSQLSKYGLDIYFVSDFSVCQVTLVSN